MNEWIKLRAVIAGAGAGAGAALACSPIAYGQETPEPVVPAEVPAAQAELLPVVPVPAPPDSAEEAQNDDSGSRNRLVTEIVVTAQKREEDLKDVPISIAAFGAEQLDARSVLDAGDLPKITPGLTITTQVGFTSTFLRGVGSDAFILGDPSVVTYVDGVYFPFALGQVQDFGSVERVEVLKGPQGTLFGRNALGGAIKIETKNPSLSAPEVSLQTIYSTFNNSRSRVYASIPLTDTFAISASGLYNLADNHVDGRHRSGRDPLPKEQSDAYRFKAFWQPSDWIDFSLNYYRLSQDAASTYAVNTRPSPLVTQLLAASGAPESDTNPRKGYNNEPIFFINFNHTTFGQVHMTAPWFDVKLLGSDQYVENNQSYDFDGTGLPLAYFESNPGFADVQTGELQLLSNGSPWSDYLEWIVGAFWFKSHAGFEPGFLRAGSTDLSSGSGTIGGIPIPPALLTQLQGALGAVSFPSGLAFNFVGLLDTKSIAYFTQATVHLTDWAAVTVGARYQDEERTVDRSSSGTRNLDGTTTLIPGQDYSADTDPSLSDTTKSFDPKLSLNFRPSVNWLGDAPLLYVNYQTATTSSTYNTINIYDAPEKVSGSEIEAYEAGFKTRLVDGLVDLNMAIFHYDIETPQVQIVSLVAGGAVRFENAGGERIRGADFDALIQLFPQLTDNGLVMTLSGAYLDTEYTSYTNGSGYDEQTSVFSSGNDYTGNRVVRAPKFSGTVGLLQSFQTGSGPVEIGADYYYNSGFYYLAQNTPSVEEKAYGTLGANISYLYEPWNVRVTVFGRNLLRENYNLARFRTDFGTNDTIAPLDTYGIRLNWDF